MVSKELLFQSSKKKKKIPDESVLPQVLIIFMNFLRHPHPGWRLNQRSYYPAAAAAKSFQSCLTLCDPIDGSPSGSPVPRILQATTLEWVAIAFSNTTLGPFNYRLSHRPGDYSSDMGLI